MSSKSGPTSSPHRSFPRRRSSKPIRDQRSRGLTQIVGFLSLLVMFLLDLKDVQLPQKERFLDLLTLFILFLLTGTLAKSLIRTFRRRSHMGHKHKKPHRWFFIHTFASGLAIFFLLFWVSRWSFGEMGTSDKLAKFHPFLHAGMILAFVAFAMGLRRVYFWWKILDVTPGRMVFFLYGVVSIIGTFFLILPWSLNPEASISFIDALFISVSALTVTGLVPVSIPETFSLLGQSFLMCLIQLGGLGIIVISVSLVVLTRNRLSLSASLMGQELYNIPSLGGMTAFIGRVILFTVITEIMAGMWMYFMLPPELPNRLFHTMFHTISAFCNAGFSSLPNNLAVPGLFGFKAVVCILVLIGSMGFPIIFELMEWVKRKRKTHHISGNTLLSLLVSAVLLIVGTVGIFLSESVTPNAPGTTLERLGEALFYSISSRTAGFNVSDVGALSHGSELIISVLMIVGGAPLSTAGGIKTTTAGIFIYSAISVMRGQKWVQFSRSEIDPLVLQKAVTIIILYFSALFAAILLLIAIEPMDPLHLTFEVISALSTVGLSLGITPYMGAASKMILIVLMVTGRLGLVTMMYVGVGRVTEQRFRYAKEEFFVG